MIDNNLYLGPFLFIETKNITVEKLNKGCKDHPESSENKQFCPDCGKRTEGYCTHEESIENIEEMLYSQFGDDLDNKITICYNKWSGPEDSIVIIPNDTGYLLDLNFEFKFEEITGEDLDFKTSEFEKELEAEIDFLKTKGYNPIIKYGFVTWAD